MKLIYNIDSVNYVYYITPTEIEEMEKARMRLETTVDKENFKKMWFAKQAFEELRKGNLHRDE